MLVDRGAFEALTGSDDDPDTAPDGTPLAKLLDRAADELAELSPFAEHGGLSSAGSGGCRSRATAHLEPWVVRRAKRPA